MGLPSIASLCTSGTDCGTREVDTGSNSQRPRTRIIPSLTFTCSGTVTHWRAAGEFRNGGNANSVLSIWRERSGGSGTYDRIDGIELGICGSEDPTPSVAGMSGVYECTLPQNDRVSVQSRDVIGIELPGENQADFRLYFDDTNNAPTNYVFSDHDTTFSLSQAISSEQTFDQPQISLTVVPDIAITIIPVLPTTQPPSMTEALSTTADLPTTPPLTSTSMSTTDLEALTFTETSMTAAAATDPSATTTTEASTTTMITETQPSTTTGSPTPDTAVMTNVSLESTAVGSTTTEMPARTTTDVQAPSGGEAVASNTETVAGSAVGAIIAVLLILISVLLLVLVLRRQSRNGQKFTPSNDATIVNPIYNGKLIVLSLDSVFH